MKKLLMLLISSFLVFSFSAIAQNQMNQVKQEKEIIPFAMGKENNYAAVDKPTNLKKHLTDKALIRQGMATLYPAQDNYLLQPSEKGYVVCFKRGQKDYVVNFNEEGKWVDSKISGIMKDEVPAKVQNAIQKSQYSDKAVANVNFYQTPKDDLYSVNFVEGEVMELYQFEGFEYDYAKVLEENKTFDLNFKDDGTQPGPKKTNKYQIG
ncbi:PepSY-like domain-containing protein [Xanthovirga aplysinae]|uniref:PepSY-like domain-containing protein n=1 Tax=Xanthovirga aplysinae TaxID=2529853 RepID=UPI0012BCA36D|nr:PepSY-like domain-containing protein [Xanthovirga aplysinae]MTI32168.1 hypothetical protein [Xanthovirga aplysinae]